jgi:tetratricopeptide (TPR) repeat protein
MSSLKLTFLFKPRFFTANCLCVLVMAVGITTASAQESLRKAVYGETSATESKKPPVRKKADPSKKTPAKTSTNVKKPAAGGTTQKKRSGNTASTRQSANRPGWISVLFESKEPNTQIFLNGNHVGTTDENRTFKWKMTPGIYRVSSVLGASVIFSEKLVQLGVDGMKITLQEEAAKKAPPRNDEPLVIPKTQAEKEMELAREMSAKVLQIFSDFLNPEKSADIMAEDWRFAANAAVLGEFQNLSKQQIEAQRKFAAGQVGLADKNYQKAFTDFRLAIQSFPGSPLPHIGLGDTYFASAQWQDAKRSYEQARSVGPNLWMAHRRLGDIYRILGEKKKAVQSYADAIKFGDTRYETRFLRARAEVDVESMETAIPLLEALLKEDARSEIHLSLGEAYEMSKRDIGALDHYRKAVELDPESPIAQYRLARIYYEQREYKKAVEGFDAALKLDGDKKSFPHEDAAEKRSVALGRIKTTSK